MKKVFTLLLATALFSSMAWADYSLTVYKGTSTAEAMVVADAAAWEAVLASYPNAVAVLDNTTANAAWAATTKNILLKTTDPNFGSVSYKCPNFVLTDLSDFMTDANDLTGAENTRFYAPARFVALGGSYHRSLKKGYNSACVPFDFTDNFTNGDVLTYVNYVEADNNAMFDPKTEVSAGVACIIDLTAAEEWNVTFNSTWIEKSPVATTGFHGVYQKTDCTGQYSVSPDNDYFSPLAGYLYPFRACFELTGGDHHNAAPRLVILSAEQATGLDAIEAAQQDMKFFQDGRLMIRHNGVVYDAKGQVVK